MTLAILIVDEDGHVAKVDATTEALQVLLKGSLPVGANVIGKVDVNSLPALPAGSNVIGHVDVDSLPSLPAGTNNLGFVKAQGYYPGGSGYVDLQVDANGKLVITI